MFSKTSTICSGQLLLATKCGTQRTMPAPAHQTVAVPTLQNAAEVTPAHSTSTMLSPSSVVQMELSSPRTNNAKMSHFI